MYAACINAVDHYHDGSKKRCSSLFIRQATNSLFQHAWTSLFKLNHVQLAGQLNNVHARQLNHV